MIIITKAVKETIEHPNSKSLQMVTAAMKLRHFFLGRKVMTNLDRVLKSKDYFANKGPSGQGYDFSSSHVWM